MHYGGMVSFTLHYLRQLSLADPVKLTGRVTGSASLRPRRRDSRDKSRCTTCSPSQACMRGSHPGSRPRPRGMSSSRIGMQKRVSRPSWLQPAPGHIAGSTVQERVGRRIFRDVIQLTPMRASSSASDALQSSNMTRTQMLNMTMLEVQGWGVVGRQGCHSSIELPATHRIHMLG